ncbi:MAG: Gfo/Idh/MocA family oxidoreductase [Planctomycetes bacterium]|nr:Gfo/Idh/MocA family oxidoreductase [Planctomycetota bacterium]MCB9904717.1 Gfo/Idh/MocA family oxidoreductase [Planctomycetota bacterium]
MSYSTDRRSLLKLGASAALLPLTGCASTNSADQVRVAGRVRHACIGVGGMGDADMKALAAHPEVDIVALCDVDRAFLEAAGELFPAAARFRDWREMFEQLEGFDSVNVTVPDHMHAPIASRALELRKHVYCQKPLTRTVSESRTLKRMAQDAGVVTQMGIQNHSASPYRTALRVFEQGHIGKIHEVHVWTDRPKGWWPQGADRKPGADPIPETLDWNLWLGVAPERPYKEGQYHPFAWRGWQDFGTGAQGDMACHLMDPALWFLDLGHPRTIRSDGPTPNGETYPLWSAVHYEFDANEYTTRGPLLLTWHDGGRKAPRQLLDDLEAGEVYDNACLFVGTEGALLVSPYDPPRLLPEAKFKDVKIEEVGGENHWFRFIDAVRGEAETNAGFDYAAHLSEIALLGNVALSFPHETLEWDAARMRFPKRPEADALLTPTYRTGW